MRIKSMRSLPSNYNVELALRRAASVIDAADAALVAVPTPGEWRQQYNQVSEQLAAATDTLVALRAEAARLQTQLTQVVCPGRVDGWMDGWMDGWIDGWVKVVVALMLALPREFPSPLGLFGLFSGADHLLLGDA